MRFYAMLNASGSSETIETFGVHSMSYLLSQNLEYHHTIFAMANMSSFTETLGPQSRINCSSIINQQRNFRFPGALVCYCNGVTMVDQISQW